MPRRVASSRSSGGSSGRSSRRPAAAKSRPKGTVSISSFGPRGRRCSAALRSCTKRNFSAGLTARSGSGSASTPGEPVTLDGQYVGSAVNLAARIGSAAQSGELLISDTVRGLLRTSGLPPLTEHPPIQLKGIQEVPRIYSVDWHHMESMSAGEDRPDRALTPKVRGRVELAAAAALGLLTGLGAVRGRRSLALALAVLLSI